MILWFILMLLAGVFGGGGVIGTLFLLACYFVLLQEPSFNNTGGADWIDLAVVAGSFVWGGLVYLIWKPQYLDRDSMRIRQLGDILNNRQKQSEILLQSIEDGVIATNSENKIGVINGAAASLTGWPADEASGLDVQTVVELQDSHGKLLPPEQLPFMRVMKEKTPVNETYTLVQHKTNLVKTVSFVTTPVIMPKSNEIVGTVSVMRDISTQHQEEARRADFISTASHEMRTPVAAIEGYLALALNEKISNIDIKARGYLEKAQDSTKHLGRLFQDLLTSAKAEDGRLTSHAVAIEMSELLEQISEDLKFSAQKKGLSMEFIIGSSNSKTDATQYTPVRPLYYALADPDRLREVITNIFDNGVKYTETGKITLGLTGDDKVVQIRVTDTGPGISAEDVPHLFQKFYRVDNSATRTVGGTGLGLFICQKIVELYGGQIWVESQVGKGSTFFVNLPRLDAKAAEKLIATEAEQRSALDHDTMN